MAEKPPATILIVDDTDSSRYAVGRLLRSAQFVVREAATGEEALRLAAERPDLVILDVNLPDMSGFEVCRRIKSAPTTASTPVLHLSASFVESANRSEGLESGADGYLTYPLEPRELIANVRAMLRVREAERAAREQRELLRVTLGSIGDGVAATDAEGRITFVNAVAQQLTGWDAADADGKPIREVFNIVNEDTGEPPAENPVEVVIRSGRTAGLANHTLLIARDGTRRPVDDTAAPIRDDEGRFVGVVLVFRDITERRRLENELRRRSEDLVERDKRKDEFLAMLAHELRNPLAPIRNGLQVLRLQLPGEPGIGRTTEMMERQLGNLVRLVDDLLDVSRITRGKFELRKERLELAPLIGRVVEGVRPFLDERMQHLEVRSFGAIELEADSSRLEQVLSNLLTNAAKYTPPGGHIVLSVDREGDSAVIRVRDDGIGIRPEMLMYIFDLFQQADRVPGRVSEGLGIGLSLVRRLVEMHGGSVTASSAGPNRGSEFVVRLPALPAQIAKAEATGPDAAGGKKVVGPLRILVTDDNADSAESMALLLRLRGHDVRTAHDGPQTLETARTFHPQVVILDIALPKNMDGYEVARRLRREVGGSALTIIAMTGYGQPEDVDRARAAGMDHHITKPADPRTLQALLAEVSASASP